MDTWTEWPAVGRTRPAWIFGTSVTGRCGSIFLILIKGVCATFPNVNDVYGVEPLIQKE